MVAFPDILTDVGATWPFEEQLQFRTLVSEFESGSETRRQKNLFVRRKITITYHGRSLEDIRALFQFFLDRHGAYEEFNLFLPRTQTYQDEYVGTGDGAQTIWNLPSKSAASYTLKLNGSPLSDGVDYTFTAQGGADGADKVELVTPPAKGAHLTWDFTGRLKIHGRFADDVMSFQEFARLLYSTGITIQGLLNK